MRITRTPVWLTVTDTIEFETGKMLSAGLYPGFVEKRQGQAYYSGPDRTNLQYILKLTPKQQEQMFGPPKPCILARDTIDVTPWIQARIIEIRFAEPAQP
jgi:hypothetical protein